MQIPLMTPQELKAVNDNVDAIVSASKKKVLQTIPPSVQEFNAIQSIILEFVKRKKRIIYGGYAQNALVEMKDPQDRFYDETSMADIEFYSNRPLEDMKELCDHLHDKGYRFIQGKNALHGDTFTIFVAFKAYADISYMPGNLMHKVETVNMDGLRLIHPKFIMVDFLRQFTTPLTSYWRLKEKTLPRLEVLMKHYPFDFRWNEDVPKNNFTKETEDIKNKTLDILAKYDVMLIGDIASSLYRTGTLDTKDAHIEILVDPLKKLAKSIYNDLKQVNPNIVVQEYHPFFQFWDRRIEISLNKQVFLTMYGTNEVCLPYSMVKINSNNFKLGTFNIVLQNELIHYHYSIVEGEQNGAKKADIVMAKMLQAKHQFFEKNKKTPLDDTIYKDYMPECYGRTDDIARAAFLERYRKNSKRVIISPYDPYSKRSSFKPEDYMFANISGKAINNTNMWVLRETKEVVAEEEEEEEYSEANVARFVSDSE